MDRRSLNRYIVIPIVVVIVIVHGDPTPDNSKVFDFVSSLKSLNPVKESWSPVKKLLSLGKDQRSKKRGENFKGGCTEHPVPPINGQVTCSSDSGCRANCNFNHKFPNGDVQLAITCRNGEWHVPGTDWTTIPHCEPICLPQCQNNGICIGPNECQCSQEFSGPQCQFENKPCLNYPPPVLNSHRRCNSKTCTITCLKNFIFPNGISIVNLSCRNGFWQPSREDWVSIPDCQPVCSPPCQNGGNCLPLNMCQCPQDFRGPQCQYSTNACTADKLGFNGGYHCTGNSESYTCTLNCPAGIEFTSPPKSEYVCTYERGTFEPQPIPQCKINEDYRIVPVESSKNSFFEVTNHSWSIHNVVGSNPESSRYTVTYDGAPELATKNGVKGIKSIRKTKTTIPEPKTCFTWGGVHYKTFDGAIYSFESTCPYTLLQETQDNAVTITAQNSKNCGNKGSCHRILKIFKTDKEYTLSLDDDGNPNFKNGMRNLPIPVRVDGLRVEMAADFVVVTLDNAGLVMKWDGKLLLQIEASVSLWNRTSGLCGRMNGDAEDDMTDRTGSRTKNLATTIAGWRVDGIGEICDEFPSSKHQCLSDSDVGREAEKFCSKLLGDPRLVGCNEIIDTKLMKNACQWDYCACKNFDKRTCACDTLNVYVRQCAHQKIVSPVGWRRNDTCPITCSNGRIYMACGPKSQPSCGSDDPTESKKAIGNCEEGCFCPEGMVLHDGKCLSPEQCPCRLRGKKFEPGASVPKDCNTCTCVSGKWICTQTWCTARCAAIGDPHYVSFDGKHFDFMGKCNYYLMKGNNYSVESENVACPGAISENMGFERSSNDKPSCTKSVTIRLGTDSIKLKQNHQIMINDKEATKLPVKVGGMKLRMGSSIFAIVNMPNGLEIWWDSISRVYVNAPPTFRGKTSGLCGTFNSNQNDDFLTPDGDVEQSVVPFANKWKTNERCSDITQEDFKNPCDTNPQNRGEAKKHCSKLWSRLFTECHWHVDPEPFYKDCMFDMCSCETKMSQCLCPTIAAYAKECAIVGVKIPWRLEIDECKIHCPRDQEYQICGNSCARSCGDISFNEDCRNECVEGCNCPEGQTLDVHGECIAIGQCPCSHAGLEFRAGYREVRPGLKSQDLCTCVAGRWSCVAATKKDIVEYPAAIGLANVCTASKNLKISSCEPIEPRTCRNMHEPLTQTPAICRPGCVCKNGYVLDLPSGECVKEKECPCYHGGKSYKEGSTVNNDCNTCKCENGRWNCTDRPCAGICSAWGDSHYKTFDGRVYDFQGVCDYVLSKARLSNDEIFEVSTQNVPCGNSGVSCSKSITFSVGSGPDQESITLTRGKELGKIVGKRITVREVGFFIFLDCPDLGVVVQWDQGTRVYVKVDPKWRGHTKGLCGDYNDNSEDDYKTPSGGISEVNPRLFADSWKKENYCSEPKEILDTCVLYPERRSWAVEKCGILKTSLFEACHSEVDLDPYLQKCIFDTCACDSGGDCECLCTALAAYAHECNAKGAPVKWRSQELCPIQCDVQCSSYSPCMSTCPHETCDNTLTLKSSSHLCSEDYCVEGCLPKPCPENHVYKNESLGECVPKEKCKLFCLTIDETTYYEGDKMESDDCQSCFCSRGKKICNGAPCKTISTIPTTGRPSVELMEQNPKCVDGWSAWINKNSPAKGKKSSDVEPLPSTLDMFQIPNSAICTKSQMTDIKCRTVGQHMTPKETGLDVECSLERGLYCKPEKGRGPCLDFEISVLCQCKQTTLTTLTSTSRPTSTISETARCDVAHPNQPHPTNCRLFYQCVDIVEGTKSVEKDCGPDMLYNPNLQVCDWPASVINVRPDCGEKNILVTSVTEKTDGVRQELKVTSDLCKPGESWNACAIPCNQTCVFYNEILKKDGRCVHKDDCVAGCVKFGKKCYQPFLWRDEDTCVKSADCTCQTHDGKSVKPGAVVKESVCEICQCLNNFYTCDKSLCSKTKTKTTPKYKQETTTKIPSSTEPTTTETPQRTTISIEDSTILVTSYVSSVAKCDSENFIPLSATDLADSMIISASTSDRYGKKNDVFTTEWQPIIMDKEQWLGIEFPQPEPIYGLIMLGSNTEDKYVTSYKILYSEDGITYSHVTNENNEPRIFSGPNGKSNSVRQIFDRPIEAKIVKINPKTWHRGIAMRIDLIGCDERSKTTKTFVPEDETTVAPLITLPTTMHTEQPMIPVCDDPMGYDQGLISDDQITASSIMDSSLKKLKLSSPGLWRSKIDNPHQYVQFDFLETRNLTGIETKGADDVWTTSYKLFYSVDSREWNPIIDVGGREKEFLGNFDDYTSRINYFDKPIRARYLRVNPLMWHNHVGLKTEIRGCFLPYPTIPTPSVTEKTKPTQPTKGGGRVTEICNVCDGVIKAINETCRCGKNNWWNGHSCVTKHDCPCVIGSITYAVGTTYQTEDCQKCICSLGGTSTCEKKICPRCDEPNLQSVVTELCGCICKPCGEGAKLCPTSNICIDEKLWCNGIQDCPDDETMCDTAKPIIPIKPSDVKTGSTSHINVTTVETLNVTKAKCEKPVCPPGYKLAPTTTEYAKTKILHRTGQSRSPTKTSTKKRNQVKKPRYQNPQPTDATPVETECPQFSCVPSKPPPFIGSTKKQNIKDCPKISCPPGYKIVYEKLSTSKLVSCPKYTCSPPPPIEVVCNVTERTFNTFDRLEYKYDICNHILARYMDDNRWYITLEKHCSARQPNCAKVLAIMIDDIDIVLYPSLSVDIGDYKYTPSQVNLLGDNRGSFKIRRIGDTLYFNSDKHGFWIIWDRNSNVKIGVTTKLANHVDGLCGYLDGDMTNDRQKPDGTLAKSSLDFGNSWIIDNAPQCETQICPHEIHERAWKICVNIRDKSLKPYSAIADVEKFLSRCLESTCTCVLGNATEENCRCQALLSFLTEHSAADRNVDISNWRTIHNCPIDCPTPFVHDDCFKKKCEISCSNLQESDPCPTMPGVCFSGCFCPDGMVRNGEDCVHPSECRDCVCNGFGNSNFITFDKKNFTFNGNCTYVLSRNAVKDRRANHTYEILMTNVPCESGVCTETITILYETHVIKISKHSKTTKLELAIDGKDVKTTKQKTSWLKLDGNLGHNIVVTIPAIQLEVTIFAKNLAFTIKLSSYTFGGAMEGLCGNCNGMIDDDMRLNQRDETTDDVNAFGMSWLKPDGLENSNEKTCSSKSREKCKITNDEINLCTTIEDLRIFGKCHEFQDPTTFVDSCRQTLCENGDACGIIEAYARSCSQDGLCVDWRTKDVCPYACPPHLEYKPCGSRCKKTCEGLRDENCQEELIEGCYCPDDHVLHDEKCIPNEKCLICDDDGHVDGETWNLDKCTSCSCTNRTVTCEKTDCSILKTICEDRYTPVLVSGSEDQCCPKYYCAPIPTPSTICSEQQQPECGYGQTMKMTTDVDGCQKIICECLPPENCPIVENEIAQQQEISEPGYVKVTDTSGCCPRVTTVCKPEMCPEPPICPKHHNISSKQRLNSCCYDHECNLSPDVCIYSALSNNDLSNFDVASAKKIGEQWMENDCKNCTCERSGNGGAMVKCFETKCPELGVDAEASEFVVETTINEGSCCPVSKRKACRQGDDVYDVNDTWHPNPDDICITVECVNVTGKVEKKLKTKNCEMKCARGYKYVSSTDRSIDCCGKCVAAGCVVDDKVINIGEEWYSEDHCVLHRCLIENDTAYVREKSEVCPKEDPSEAKRFKLKRISSPKQCCEKNVRVGCIYEGAEHEVGDKWTLKDDKCVEETCVLTANGVDVIREIKVCNEKCPVGWRYKASSDGKCCGECKQTSCIVDEKLYEPGSVWYSDDNCTTFTCSKQADQFVVSSSSPVCPIVKDCPKSGTYFDGCCNQCNITTLNQLRACAADVLELRTTVGILKTKRGKHGICQNLNGIEGLTECHGDCSSSTKFDTRTWKQIHSCECCQPSAMHTISVDLTCDDGSVFTEDLTVPTSCSCKTCGALKKSVKGR